MADEILVLEGDGNGTRYELLMLFPISTPKQVGGQNVIPTPVERDDANVALYPFTLLTQAERDALDAGTSYYVRRQFGKIPGLTNPQLVALAQAMYASIADEIETAYVNRYAHIGVRIDA
jgi:hypothetical protein